MKEYVNKILRIFLCVVFIMTIIPMGTVNADETVTEYNLWVGGVRVTSANASNITGTGITGTVSYDADKNTLTLDGAKITEVYEDVITTDSAGIYYNGSDKLTINSISDSDVDLSKVTTDKKNLAGICSTKASLIFTGSGKLTVTSGTTTDYDSYGICSDYNITVEKNANVTATGGTAYCSYGVYVDSNLTVEEGATLTATGGTATDDDSYGIAAGINITVEDKATLTATGGTANDSSFGVCSIDGNITVNGTVEAFGETDAFNKKPNELAGYIHTVTAGDSKDVAEEVSDVSVTDYHREKYVKMETTKLYDLWVGGERVTSANASNITGEGITGTVSYDANTNTLNLDGANITGVYEDVSEDISSGIYYTGTDPFTINTISDSTVDLSKVATNLGVSIGICSFGSNLIFTGSGKLTSISGVTKNTSFGVMAVGNITVDGNATLTATGANVDNFSLGVNSNGNLAVKENATLTATGGTANFSYGVFDFGNPTVNGTVEAFGEIQAFYEKPRVLEGLKVKSGVDRTSATIVSDLANTDYHLDNFAIIYKEVEYDIIEGDNQKPTFGTNKELILKSEGDFDKFIALWLNDELVDSSNYIASEGSTIITLKPEYVKTMSLGEKVFRFEFIDGYSVANMTVMEPYNVSYDDGVTDEIITVPTDEADYQKDAEVTVSTIIPTREGYTFKGWKDLSTVTTPITITEGKFIMPERDVTLTAQWEKNAVVVVPDETDTDKDTTTGEDASTGADVSTGADTSTDKTAPDTGDNSNMRLYLILVLVSLSGVATIIYRRKIVK